jgi:hypothetical protein
MKGKVGSLHAAMGKRKPSLRTVRRTQARLHAGLVKDLERLARLAPGGAPDRPLDIEAPTQVEPIAEATACPLCKATLRVDRHASETHDGTRLRVAHMRCTSCGVERAFYFRLAGVALD